MRTADVQPRARLEVSVDQASDRLRCFAVWEMADAIEQNSLVTPRKEMLQIR
jgi:hypothetical protein